MNHSRTFPESDAELLRLDAVLGGYLACAVWASTNDEGEPLDSLGYTVDDLTGDAVNASRADVEAFLGDNAGDLAGLDPEQIGHDFWLTRNRHGAGFWDRGLGAVGERLTNAAHAYGTADLYVNDDGGLDVA